MLWRIYYAGGGTFSDEDGDISAAPALGVQAIVKRDSADHIDNVGRRVLDRADYYWWQDSEWYGGDILGLFDYLQRPGWKKVLFGRSISVPEFMSIRKRALDDPDFPRYSGR